MMSVVKQINFHDVEEGLPAFFTMAFIPLTYSLINGIFLGLVTHTFINVFSGKWRKVRLGTYLMTLLFVLVFALASTFALRKVQTRGAIIAAAGVGGAAGGICLVAVYVIASKSLGTTLMDAAWVLLSALFSGLLVVGSLSIWENLFDIATPARLNELLNTSNPLLKQLM